VAKVTIEGLKKYYGDVHAVDGVDLVINDKEFVVLLGPSGCGKTTTLRCISGLERPTEGRVLFNGQRVDQLDPATRNIAMVFQFFALYPHLKVHRIISFPLRARKMPKRKIREKLEWVTEMFKLSDLLDCYVGGMPPGDMQKVALARAVVRDPNVLLLDEPLSALDEKYREEMRWQLGHMQRELQVTTIYVTHDQREAMSLGDRIILMCDGKIVQDAPPEEIYQNPTNQFSGYFIGSPGMNFFEVVFDGTQLLLGEGKWPFLTSEEVRERLTQKGTKEAVMGIRPEYLSFSREKPSDDIGCLPVSVFSTEHIGNYSVFSFRIAGKIFHGMVEKTNDVMGDGIVRFEMDKLRFFDKTTGQALF
jgi:ABC-type sugar transport system ATPase subunit